MSRLFVAVDLDEPARDLVAEAIELLRAAGVDARFSARDKWHATLAFLGPIAPERRPAVYEAVDAAAAASEPFELTLDAVGAFPSPNRPRVVWVGSSKSQPEFAACTAAVRTRLAALDLQFEGDAVPHVTVCRIKRPATALPPVALNRSARVRVDALTVYESVPAGRTTAYHVLRRASLGRH